MYPYRYFGACLTEFDASGIGGGWFGKKGQVALVTAGIFHVKIPCVFPVPLLESTNMKIE